MVLNKEYGSAALCYYRWRTAVGWARCEDGSSLRLEYCSLSHLGTIQERWSKLFCFHKHFQLLLGHQPFFCYSAYLTTTSILQLLYLLVRSLTPHPHPPASFANSSPKIPLGIGQGTEHPTKETTCPGCLPPESTNKTLIYFLLCPTFP